MRCAIRLKSPDSAAGERLVVKLIVIMSGREGKTGYGGIRHAPVGALSARCVTQPMAQITGQHGNARHG
jgi:hypothetical protein